MEAKAREFWKPEWKVKDEFQQRTDTKIHQNESMNSPETVTLEGHEFCIFPGVFSPSIFIGSKFVSNRLAEFLPNSGKFLEIGCGCGCLTILAAKAKPELQIFASDISRIAIENTKENLKRHNLTDRVTVELSDVMDSFVDAEGVEKFDCVFWNFPFHHTEKQMNELTLTERAIRDPYYTCLHKLFHQAKQLVKLEGKILIGFSAKLGIVEAMMAIAQHHGWSATRKADGREFLGEKTFMEIYECLRCV